MQLTKSSLTFSPGNAKLKGIPSLSLLAGWSCPFADQCLTKVDLNTGKLQDGPHQQYRCFSATQENIFKLTRQQRFNNFELLRKCSTPEEMAALIQAALPTPKSKIIRIHVSGDFFNQKYFDAWMLVAKNNPDLLFYTYTKSLQFWINRMAVLPTNLKITASMGGRQDHLIQEFNLKYVKVVGSVEEAAALNLELDHDDSHAYASDKSFALLIHGTQAKGSAMGKAKAALRKQGITGYRRKDGWFDSQKKKNKFRGYKKVSKLAA